MCYFTAREYEIVPTDTYEVLRDCPGCNAREKSVYHCTGKFRVNANGKMLDVWLIYRCCNCGQTCNVPIYSRMRINALDRALYEALLRNDPDVVARYALDRAVFQRNGFQLARELPYEVRALEKAPGGAWLRFHNPCRIRLRHDKLLAQSCGISRAQAKKMLDQGLLTVCKSSETDLIVRFEAKSCHTESCAGPLK